MFVCFISGHLQIYRVHDGIFFVRRNSHTHTRNDRCSTPAVAMALWPTASITLFSHTAEEKFISYKYAFMVKQNKRDFDKFTCNCIKNFENRGE